jgi:hypothetical protein
MSGAVSRGENTDVDLFMSLSRCLAPSLKGECATSMRKTPDFRVRTNMTITRNSVCGQFRRWNDSAQPWQGHAVYNRNQGCDSMGQKDGEFIAKPFEDCFLDAQLSGMLAQR